MRKRKKVILGMSGGVDSSVACLLLLKKGFEVIGITLRLLDEGDIHKRSCCSIEDIYDAEKVADSYNIPHYVLDRRKEFREKIIKRYIEYYKKGMTPNPCTWCNEIIKFNYLFDVLQTIEGDYIATGHYARIIQHKGHHYIAKGKDPQKDQSYFLYSVDRKLYPKILFPLGSKTKEMVKKIAKMGKISTFRKRESQQACFLPEEGNKAFLKKHLGELEGDFVDINGRVIGTHSGYWFYTIGQRKGLGISSNEKLYVKEKLSESNRVVLSPQKDIYTRFMKVDNIVESEDNIFKEGKEFLVQIRYRDKQTKCRIVKKEGKMILVELDKPKMAITPGQAAVFYKGEKIVGGGEISKL